MASQVADQLSAASARGVALSYERLNPFGWFDKGLVRQINNILCGSTERTARSRTLVKQSFVFLNNTVATPLRLDLSSADVRSEPIAHKRGQWYTQGLVLFTA